MTRPTDADKAPLVVDLDGSLIRSDVLYETLFRALSRRPFAVLAMPMWLLGGRAHLKAQLARHAGGLQPEGLPYREDVLRWLRSERENGRRLVLATAADGEVASCVAAHLGVFDEIIASTPTRNLKGEEKRLELVRRYGEHGFDYAGDCAADLPVWESARHAFVLDGPSDLAARIGRPVTEMRLPKSSRWGALARSLRPHQWIKNALVLVPLLTAHRVSNPSSLYEAVLALVSFSLLASSAYVLNDLVDLESDRRDPAKRTRPFASGDLPIAWGVVAGAFLLLSGAFAASFLGPAFFAVAAAYLFGSVSYTFALKRVPILDVIVLAGLYTLRIVAGAFAIDVPLSHWLLGFSMFVFLSIALAKRHGELARLGAENFSRRGYRAEDLLAVGVLGMCSAMVSLVILALYVSSQDVLALYTRPVWLWLLVPVFLYWLARIWLITLRRELHEDPVLFAVRDPASYGTVVLCLVAVAAAI